jgi:hypothetical protein
VPSTALAVEKPIVINTWIAVFVCPMRAPDWRKWLLMNRNTETIGRMRLPA